MEYEVSSRMLPLAQQYPPRENIVLRECHAAKLAAVDVGNSVVPGQLFVHEGVVRRQQFGDAAVAEQHAVQEQVGFLLERVAQIFVEVPKQEKIGLLDVDVAQIQHHCAAKLLTSASERGSASMRCT